MARTRTVVRKDKLSVTYRDPVNGGMYHGRRTDALYGFVYRRINATYKNTKANRKKNIVGKNRFQRVLTKLVNHND